MARCPSHKGKTGRRDDGAEDECCARCSCVGGLSPSPSREDAGRPNRRATGEIRLPTSHGRSTPRWCSRPRRSSPAQRVVVKEVFSQLTKYDISTDGLFLNADPGFDAKEFRHMCLRMGVFANVAFNYRAGGGEDCYLFDDILYKERYSIERTNAWLDSYRSLLNRFDVTLISWQAWNYIAFIVILMKKVKKKQKSR